MSSTGRRSRSSSAAEKRRATLENLKKARSSLSSRTEQHELKEEEDVYDILDESQYEKLVEERRQKDDFVIDDDGLGYADDGEEHLGVEADAYEASKDDLEDDGKDSKAVRKARKLNRAAYGVVTQKNTMFNFVRPGCSMAQNSSAAEVSAEEVPDVDDLLNDFASNKGSALPPSKSSHQQIQGSRARVVSTGSNRSIALSHSRKLSAYGPSTSALTRHHQNSENVQDSYDGDGNENENVDHNIYNHDNDDNDDGRREIDVVCQDEDISTPMDSDSAAVTSTKTVVAPVIEETQKLSLTKTNKKLKMTAPSQVLEEAPNATLRDPNEFKPVLSSSTNNVVVQGLAEIGCGQGSGLAPISLKPGAAVDPRWWLQKTAPTDGQPESSGKEYVTMYWTDAVDVNGIVYLFGKIPVHQPGSPKRFESCCVAVHGMQRNLFVLAKKTDEVNDDGTLARAAMADVHKDLTKILVPSIIPKEAGQGFRCKVVQRNYAFEHEDVPRQKQEYLKVVYPAKFGSPSADVCAGGSKSTPHIEKIFGAASSPLELFLLKRKLMGPCWVIINNPRMITDPVSWCRIEIGVENPKFIVKMSSDDAPIVPPPLVVMSVSMKTAVNPTTHVHEIIALSAVVHTKVDMEGESEASSQHMRRFTLIRQLGRSCGPTFPPVFPHNLAPEAAKACGGTLLLFPNEREMLIEFFQRIHTEDPDLLASHNLFGFEFDVLISRAVVNKVPTWSKIGRFQRSRPPKSISDKDLAAGRLLCDTYKASKEFLRETTYSLTHLSLSQLAFERADVDPVDVPKYFTSTVDVIRLANHTAWDSLLVLRLMLKLQIVPLTKQLTNLSGNIWARTMRGARAERIEFLLLHEFHCLKYILPEKKAYENKKGGVVKGTREAEDEEDDAEEAKVGGRARVRSKAAYAGGLVLEPKKGLYDTFILLLDFNSLYPSLIQEYNLCFTTIDWTKFASQDGSSKEQSATGSNKIASKGATNRIDGDEDGDDDDDDDVGAVDSAKALPPVPHSSVDPGVLPRVIRTLVERRKLVKGLLKKERDPAVRQQLDIKQKALKLTANSMYGCLGFTFSRFYARPIAALVTAMGREALQRTVDLATNQLGLEVIYGDTDSVMINTGSVELERVKEIGLQVTKEVNKLYRCLELDIDGIFKSMLLLKKKKYAALTVKEVDGGLQFEKEMKGLDLVRRDWCPLSQEAGKYVVGQILSGRSRDEIVNDVHEFLSNLAEKVRQGQEDLSRFVITKGLNKSPKDYPDCKGQAHLQVALQMLKNNRPVNIGDHIPYVICVQGPDGASPAQRANHPDDVLRSNGAITVDFEWYLTNQILPPIARLCEPIDGTSQARIATQLGLDASRFTQRTTNDDFMDESWGFTPRCLMDDSERFKDCQQLLVTCRACKVKSAFFGPLSETGRSGLNCSECGSQYWGRHFAADLYCCISNRVTILVRECVRKYYDCWLVCDDHSCGRRTMHQSAMGLMCTENCHGRMIVEYDEAALHNQLKYLETLFDVPRYLTKQSTATKIPVADLTKKFSPHQTEIFNLLKQHMENAINGSAYNWVRPSLWTAVCGMVPSASTVPKTVSGHMV